MKEATTAATMLSEKLQRALRDARDLLTLRESAPLPILDPRAFWEFLHRRKRDRVGSASLDTVEIPLPAWSAKTGRAAAASRLVAAYQNVSRGHSRN